MENTLHLTIQQTRFPELKRLIIGDQVFLISKLGILKRKEILCHVPFKRVPIENGIALHLNFKNSYIFKGKLLEVEAISSTNYGPLGDRLILNVWYDGNQIGSVSALKSYMGGGVNGDWPIIRDRDGILFFKFSTNGLYGNESEFIIEYYETIIYDPIPLLSTNIRRSPPKDYSLNEILNNEYSINEIDRFKEIEWLIPLKNQEGKKIGQLSSCSFKGLDRFYISYWNKKDKFEKLKKSNIIFSKSIDSETLFSFDYNTNGISEREYPWPYMHIIM